MRRDQSQMARALEALMQKGDHMGAIAVARTDQDAMREDAEASRLYGFACAMVGDFSAAREALKGALSLNSADFAARGALARVCILIGARAEAEDHMSSLSAQAGDRIEAAENLIEAYLQAGRAEEAFQALMRAASRFGRERFDARLAEAAIRTRRTAIAIEASARAEARFGLTPPIINAAGPAAILADDSAKLSKIAVLVGALPAERGAAIYDFWTSVLMSGGFHKAAQASAELAAQALPTPARWRLVSDLRLANRDAAGAETAALKALSLHPDDAAAMTLLARRRIVAGEIGEAKRLLLQAIKADPACPAAFDNLTQIDAGAMTEAMAENLQRLVDRQALPPDGAAKALLALARRDEASGHYARAFDRFISAKTIIAEAAEAMGRGYNPKNVENAFDATKRHFPAPISFHQPMPASPRPIFVVGMPRSGTTLVEQILSAHPETFGAGEMPTMVTITNEFHALAAAIGAEQALRKNAARWTDRYLNELPVDARKGPAFVDKHPLNFWGVGLIFALFPQARVVNLSRSPVDVCLSILRVRFFDEYDFANRIDEAAHYYAVYDQVTAHWRNLFGDRLHNVEYEALVDKPENEIRALLDYCGLDFDPTCLRFHENRQGVITHSAAQVREPINKRSLERRSKYGEALMPLEDALRRFGVAVPEQ